MTPLPKPARGSRRGLGGCPSWLSGFFYDVAEECVEVLAAKADGSYWRDHEEQAAPDYMERGNFVVGGGE